MIMGNAILCAKIHKDSLHPTVLFNFYWFLLTFFPLIIVIEVPVFPFAILFILIVCLSFTLSSLPYANFVRKQSIKTKVSNQYSFNTKFIRTTFKISLVSSLILSIFLLRKHGFSLTSFSSEFLVSASEIAKKRTHEESAYGFSGILSVFFTYFSALLGGLISYYFSGKQKYIYVFLALLPSLFVMLTQSSKIVFLVAALLVVSANFLLMARANKDIRINLKLLKRIFYYSLLLIPILIISFMSREGYNDFGSSLEAYNTLKPIINSYFFGSIFSFSDFFSAYVTDSSISEYKIEKYNMGYYSFKSIFDSFGGTKVFPPTFYPDEFSYKKVLTTNLFTAFRGFVQDFGVVGTILFFFCFGLIFNTAYFKFKFFRNSILSESLYIMFITFLGLSFIINIFTARYIFLLCFAFIVVSVINNIFQQQKIR